MMSNELDLPTQFIFDLNPFICHQLLQLFDGAGYAATSFQSIDQMIEGAQPDFPAAVVVVDNGGGFDVADFSAQIKSVNGHLPMIMISPNVDVKNTVEAMRDGVDELVEMPYVDRILLEKIDSLLEKQS